MSAAFLIAGHVSAVSVKMHEFEEGQRWLLGAGLGIGVLCLWMYGMLYKAEDRHDLMLPKTLRIGMRLVIAIILTVVPVTHEHLNATQFMVLVMGLIAFLTIWETFGGLLKGATVFEPWTDDHPPVGALLRREGNTPNSST
ncbi:hypothetical protein NQ176_g9374 [Zarea fungicola]|uniref:Uncharacterized protein n=1 Tax=Zarea fungicola TaxID=93591 RepID=A0ACC1MM65_9HYPO|nr:hypothetical protein NQ176_g9374 [Lecanicillium fungicola]